MKRVSFWLAFALPSSLVVLTYLLHPEAGAQSRHSQGQMRVAHRDLEIQLDDDVKVRSTKPPIQLDEKGKPRKLTAEELKELKGTDSKIPGYARSPSDLKQGQVVRVHLSRPKRAKRDEKGANAEPKKAAEPNEKPSWISVGQLTGVVVRLGNKKEDGPNKQDGAGNATKKVTLRVEYARSGRGGQADAAGTGTLGKEVYATMIVIVQDVKTPAKPPGKGQEDK